MELISIYSVSNDYKLLRQNIENIRCVVHIRMNNENIKGMLDQL